MKYAYRCPVCRGEILHDEPHDRLNAICRSCGAQEFKRVFSFSMAIPFKEHFNAATGQVVSSKTKHADILKAQSETETIRSGVEHKFVPVDPADAKTVYGIKDDVLEQVRADRAKYDLAHGKTLDDVSKTRTFAT